ncbi:MAG: hypothetical protein JWN62_4744 [Acidimicrobiales bacterium]|nr:hypothetical protein [Acidimicrobiales bacterium]
MTRPQPRNPSPPSATGAESSPNASDEIHDPNQTGIDQPESTLRRQTQEAIEQATIVEEHEST